jgi:hypothetical protein
MILTSVRVFFAVERRKMYREPVNERADGVTSRYAFSKLLEVTLSTIQ